MGKANGNKSSKIDLKKATRTGLAATGFVTAVIVVLVICFMFKIDIRVIIAIVAIALVLGAGVPLFIFAVRENNDKKDESETCRPIILQFQKHPNTERLIADYRAWQQGEHSSYVRVHFGGEIVYELQGAKAYEEALEILYEIGTIPMKGRERFDYENYREQVEPQLLEGIEKEKKRAEERARNKNLKK